MRDLTIVITGSSAHIAIAKLMGIDTDSIDVTSVNAHAGFGTDIGPGHRVYSQVFPELKPVDVTPVLDEETGNFSGPVTFDPEELKPQQLTHSACKQLRIEQPGVFFAPVAEPEPEPEPRYKTHMTGSEFARDVLKREEWEAVEKLAQSNERVAAWRDVTLAGGVWVEHPDFTGGLDLAGALLPAVFTPERIDEIKKGLLIQ